MHTCPTKTCWRLIDMCKFCICSCVKEPCICSNACLQALAVAERFASVWSCPLASLSYCQSVVLSVCHSAWLPSSSFVHNLLSLDLASLETQLLRKGKKCHPHCKRPYAKVCPGLQQQQQQQQKTTNAFDAAPCLLSPWIASCLCVCACVCVCTHNQEECLQQLLFDRAF